MEVKNAIIEDAVIDTGDRGFLTAWVYLNYGGIGQGFGGFSLCLPKSFKNHNDPVNYAGHFIYRVMEVAGVGQWEDLKGKTIRVKSEYSKVHSIGHIVKDDWFDPAKEFEELKESVGKGVLWVTALVKCSSAIVTLEQK
jgi:hypothetical protein